jgi:hypothetical protein
LKLGKSEIGNSFQFFGVSGFLLLIKGQAAGRGTPADFSAKSHWHRPVFFRTHADHKH